jgi:hypothetical protein
VRSLTLTQPYAGLVGFGIKPDENRPRPLVKREDFGKPFAIHASREIDETGYDTIRSCAPALMDDDDFGGAPWYLMTRVTSAVIAIATIERCAVIHADWLYDAHTHDKICPLRDRPWAFGTYVYMLRDVRALMRPVPCRGWQGFWTLSARIEPLVMAELPGWPWKPEAT